jgi:hypothetical protein
MLWLAVWIVAAAIVIAVVVFSVNNRRFGNRVAREARAVLTAPDESRPLDRRSLEGLPAPVQRYLGKALGSRTLAVRSVRLRHGGAFRPKLSGAWLPIRGRQYFAADPPGFVWWGRVRVAPGVWVEALDRCVSASGSMLVTAESTFTLVDRKGPEIDQGGLLRLLPEMAWFPTAFLDERYVTWSPIDDRHARAVLHVHGQEVAGTFEFGEDDLVAGFSASRYRDLGGGKAVLTPFSGECRDYREVGGLLVPHLMTASWHLDGQRVPYARFEVEELGFDEAGVI